MSIHLILGGARSGKSRHAEALATTTGHPVSVIATAEGLDDEMRARIERHRLDRPSGWHTVECPLRLADALSSESAPGRCVIVDCLTLWIANLLGDDERQRAPASPAAHPALVRERAALLAALPRLPGDIILVANEVGLGLVPETPLGRLFRDEAGRLNQAVATLSDRVSFVAAGLALTLK